MKRIFSVIAIFLGIFYISVISCACDRNSLGGGNENHDYADWITIDEAKYLDSNTVIGRTLKRSCKNCGSKQLYANASDGYKFSGWNNNGSQESIILISCEQESENVVAKFVIDALNIPVFRIDTLNYLEISSKENYVTCDISLFNTENVHCLDSVSAGIRLRGNSTFGYPKKPYRIKFDKKQSVFGWEKNKSWVLLAMYQDFSNIKDYAAFYLAESIAGADSSFVPHAKHVELYLNGEYKGIYLFADQVQENAGRTDVEADINETDIEVPFLVEWDEYAPSEGTEDIDWFKIENTDTKVISYFNIKYPDVNQDQFNYIKNYIIQVNNLCHSPDTSQKSFMEMVDLPSFIDYYLIQELMGQNEINWKSIYMSKKIGEPLKMGPIWDFDWAAGGPMSEGGQISPTNPIMYSNTNWFFFMLQKVWFRQLYFSRLNDVINVLNTRIEQLEKYKQAIYAVSERNEILWHFDSENELPLFSEYYDFVIYFIRTRLKALAQF